MYFACPGIRFPFARYPSRCRVCLVTCRHLELRARPIRFRRIEARGQAGPRPGCHPSHSPPCASNREVLKANVVYNGGMIERQSNAVTHPARAVECRGSLPESRPEGDGPLASEFAPDNADLLTSAPPHWPKVQYPACMICAYSRPGTTQRGGVDGRPLTAGPLPSSGFGARIM